MSQVDPTPKGRRQPVDSKFSTAKPAPLIGATQRLRKVCPVCGDISYSHAGIHPQCAMRLADAPHVERLKRLRKAALDATR